MRLELKNELRFVDVMRLFTVVRIKTSNCFAARPKTVTPQANQKSSVFYLPQKSA